MKLRVPLLLVQVNAIMYISDINTNELEFNVNPDLNFIKKQQVH